MNTTQKTQASGRKRIILAGGTALVAAGLVTAAAFTDIANLNLGNGADDGSFGGGDTRFNIQVVGTDAAGVPVPGTWQEADTEAGVNIAVPGADLLTPGDSISVDVPFRNESPELSAGIAFSLQERPGATSSPAFAAALRYTVALDGVALVTAVDQAAVADLDLGEYATGEDGVLSLTIALPDQGSAAANNALQQQSAAVQAHFDAVSVQP